ncbi:MAG: hypothetical protein J6S83_11700, partial [Lachnospiraceae bacterium]|nr:hypothetical protein [Lachnospiraceae bacterium]
MISGINPFQDGMDLPFILRGKIKTVKENEDAFSFLDGKTVFPRRPARLNVMGIHKHPRSVFIPEGIPDLTAFKRAPESSILFKFPGDSRVPGLA